MDNRYVILPAHKYSSIRLVKIPKDFEQPEPHRHITGLLAQVEEENPDYDWNDIAAMLEDHDIEIIDFALGPALD